MSNDLQGYKIGDIIYNRQGNPTHYVGTDKDCKLILVPYNNKYLH